MTRRCKNANDGGNFKRVGHSISIPVRSEREKLVRRTRAKAGESKVDGDPANSAAGPGRAGSGRGPVRSTRTPPVREGPVPRGAVAADPIGRVGWPPRAGGGGNDETTPIFPRASGLRPGVGTLAIDSRAGPSHSSAPVHRLQGEVGRGCDRVGRSGLHASRTCHECGHCKRSNRKSQAEFSCKACGYRAHADANAARNIRAQALSKRASGLGNQPENRMA